MKNINETICCAEEITSLIKLTSLIERNKFKVKGFSTSGAYCLIELLKAERLCINEISKKLSLEKSSVTRLVSNLIKSNLVEKEKCHTDKRKCYISLTQEGRKKAKELHRELIDYYKETLSSLNIEEKGKVSFALDKLIEVFSNRMEEKNEKS